MEQAEKSSIRISIAYANEKLQAGLMQDEEASQLRRMIYYYEAKLKKAEEEDNE